jgi:hypothetical protein
MVKLQFTWSGQKITKLIYPQELLNDIRHIESYTNTFNCKGYFYWYYFDWNKQEIVIGLVGDDKEIDIVKSFKLEF